LFFVCAFPLLNSFSQYPRSGFTNRFFLRSYRRNRRTKKEENIEKKIKLVSNQQQQTQSKNNNITQRARSSSPADGVQRRDPLCWEGFKSQKKQHAGCLWLSSFPRRTMAGAGDTAGEESNLAFWGPAGPMGLNATKASGGRGPGPPFTLFIFHRYSFAKKT
jgi:hypothetical protein